MKTIGNFILTFAFIFVIIPNSLAQDKKFNIGIQSGLITPSNSVIEGFHTINYTNGSPVDLYCTGFGTGAIINVYAKYIFSNNTGLMLEGGVNLFTKNSNELALAPNGEIDMYENKLTIFPVQISLVHNFIITESKFIPYMGAGFGVYISEMEQKHFPENAPRTWLKANKIPVGVHFLSGFSFPIYHDLMFNFQFTYNYAAADWKIQDVDSDAEIEFKNLKIGGVSLKLGIGFRF